MHPDFSFEGIEYFAVGFTDKLFRVPLLTLSKFLTKRENPAIGLQMRNVFPCSPNVDIERILLNRYNLCLGG